MGDIKQVVSIIEQALNVASTKGAFGLKDSAVVSQALDLLKAHFESKEVSEDAEVAKSSK